MHAHTYIDRNTEPSTNPTEGTSDHEHYEMGCVWVGSRICRIYRHVFLLAEITFPLCPILLKP